MTNYNTCIPMSQVGIKKYFPFFPVLLLNIFFWAKDGSWIFTFQYKIRN
jgi:hypothetical protein